MPSKMMYRCAKTLVGYKKSIQQLKFRMFRKYQVWSNIFLGCAAEQRNKNVFYLMHLKLSQMANMAASTIIDHDA